jgi:hypothetical protein
VRNKSLLFDQQIIFESASVDLEQYVTVSSSQDDVSDNESTTCEPPSPTIPAKHDFPSVPSPYYADPDITLPSWRAFASLSSQGQPSTDTWIEATRPPARPEIAEIHTTWPGLPTDLEPFFGSWLGLNQSHEIPVSSLGALWGQWLTACAREYCRNLPGQVQTANQIVNHACPSLQSQDRGTGTQAANHIPTSSHRKRRCSF